MIINKLTPSPDIEARRGRSLIIEAVAWSPVASVSAEEELAESIIIGMMLRNAKSEAIANTMDANFLNSINTYIYKFYKLCFCIVVTKSHSNDQNCHQANY